MPTRGVRIRFAEHCHVLLHNEMLALSNVLYSEQFTHFFVEEPASWAIRLHPFAVYDELRNSAFAHVFDEVVGCFGCALNIHFFEWNIVLLQEVLGFTAVAAPKSSVDGYIHDFNRSKNLA